MASAKLVLVTGAARGLGAGICRQVGAAGILVILGLDTRCLMLQVHQVLQQDPGCELLVAARQLAAAQEQAALLGSRARAVQCDVADEDAVQKHACVFRLCVPAAAMLPF